MTTSNACSPIDHRSPWMPTRKRVALCVKKVTRDVDTDKLIVKLMDSSSDRVHVK